MNPESPRLSRLVYPGISLLLALAALPAIGRADAANLEERLHQLELKVTSLAQENSTLKKQLGWDAKGNPGPVAAIPQGKETKLAIGGFVQVHGEFGDAPDARFPAADRFLMRRARLGLKGSFAENLDFVMQADFGNNSLNSTSGFRAQLTDMFVVWNKYSAAAVTVGQLKVPYGYEQLLADAKIFTIERSLPNDMLTLPRQIGVMVSGGLLDKRVTWAGFVGNGNGNNISYNDNDQFDYVGRVAATLYDKHKVKITSGVNAFRSYDTGTFTGHRSGQGVDAQVAYAGAELDAELLRTDFDRDAGADYAAEGWVLMGSYYVVPGRWQGVFRYESYDPNRSIGRDHTILRTIGVNYLLKGDDLKLSFNYLIGNPPGTAGHQNRLICRLQVVY